MIKKIGQNCVTVDLSLTTKILLGCFIAVAIFKFLLMVFHLSLTRINKIKIKPELILIFY